MLHVRQYLYTDSLKGMMTVIFLKNHPPSEESLNSALRMNWNWSQSFLFSTSLAHQGCYLVLLYKEICR